jgi:hypothetical protein
LDLSWAELKLIVKDQLSDADQGSESLRELGEPNVRALFGLSEVKREQPSRAELIFEELLDVGGQGVIVLLFDDLVLRFLGGIEKGNDVLFNLPDRQDGIVPTVDSHVIFNIIDCFLHFCECLLVPAFNKVQIKLDFDEVSLAESLFQVLSGSEAFQSAIDHDGQLGT